MHIIANSIFIGLLGMGLLLAGATRVMAAKAQLSVASNFLSTTKLLIADFSAQSKHQILLSSGSTGKLYAQIVNGAPYDIFLSADSERPALLEQQGLTKPRTRFVYAIGRLVLWGPDIKGDKVRCLAELKAGAFKRFAIANPKTAPYGLAAKQTLTRLGLWAKVSPHLVTGENISQTLQFVSTGNAQMGLVSSSQLQGRLGLGGGCQWPVPAQYHDGLTQEGVLLKRGGNNLAALSFLAYLKGSSASAIILSHGYDLP